MNVVKLMGGLGNQLFQYAFGRMLQECGKDTAYDISSCETGRHLHSAYPRPYRLDKFQITNLKVSTFIVGNPIVLDHRVGCNLDLFKLQNHNFEGYWQYLDYYIQSLPIFQQEFQLKSEVYTEEFLKLVDVILDTNSVSVHVRRGDYQTHKGVFRDLPAKYYFNAITQVKGDLFIFSDDIPWCKEIFKKEYFRGREITFVDLEDYLCLELMKFCKSNIITNSTFSWWAAFLNDNLEKIVICPKHWLGDQEIDTIHYPLSWIKSEDYVVY